ncbi:MAG: hypothetical protein J5601_03475, partial [Elusimicrobiaceae bacterium]|nr:hypothetical protein [Elusimicrobiaceae bacterium]
TSLLLAPLSLVRGGNYNYGYGSLGSQSSFGYYWSQRLDNAANGYRLRFNSGNVYPQVSYYRGDGFSLRCLAR